MPNSVTIEDLGIGTLAEDSHRLLNRVIDDVAMEVQDRMRAEMVKRTGEAAASVTVFTPGGQGAGEFIRNVGPTMFYAYWLEVGWVQIVAYGQKLKAAVHHPGAHFARDAIQSVTGLFEERIGEAMQRLGK
jgi:hypothetical protein